jgi:hypothetical protein
MNSITGPTPSSSLVSSQEVVYISGGSVSNKEDYELDRTYLVIPSMLLDYNIKIDSYVLVNYAYNGLSFMNEAGMRMPGAERGHQDNLGA